MKIINVRVQNFTGPFEHPLKSILIPKRFIKWTMNRLGIHFFAGMEIMIFYRYILAKTIS